MNDTAVWETYFGILKGWNSLWEGPTIVLFSLLTVVAELEGVEVKVLVTLAKVCN